MKKIVIPVDEAQIELIKEAIRSIRNIRAEMNVPHSRKAKMIFVANGEVRKEHYRREKVFLKGWHVLLRLQFKKIKQEFRMMLLLQ